MSIYLQPYQKYAQFSGRASRKEYWSFYLFQTLVMVGLAVLFLLGLSFEKETAPAPGESDASIGMILTGGAFILFALGSMVPLWACMVRRLHDRGINGWFSLLSLVPYAGGVVIMVLLCLPGNAGPNKYGDDPKASGE